MENNKLPIYKLTIDENDSDEYTFALVDQPAIDKYFQAFSEVKKQVFQIQNEEKRIISGALMVANMPIFRSDEQGQYYVMFDGDTITKIAQKFFKNSNQSNVNLMHDPKKQVDGVYMFESIVIDSQRCTKAPASFGELPDGSWFGSFKVENDLIWNEFIKTGVFKGFSIEGLFKHEPQGEASAQTLENLHDRMAKLRSELEKLKQSES